MPNIDATKLQTAASIQTAQFEAAKAQALTELRQRLAAWLDGFVAPYPEAEQLSFSDQMSAAVKIQMAATLNTVEQTLMAGATAITGETDTDWATRVMGKAAAFAGAVSAAAGLRTAFEGQIAGATDQAALDVVLAAMRAQLNALP